MNVTPRAKALFLDVLDQPAERRESFLAERCAGDSAMLRRVEAMLRAYDRAADVFSTTAAAVRPAAAPELAPGDRVAEYALLERIGAGGFGVVFLAEQHEPVPRQVALKVLKVGMDAPSVVARFTQELQALALMDHPNIARVLDAGSTETGRPFFVMERVVGSSLTAYCSAGALDLEARLRLVIAVCMAVQHAHQKGIIHRDLKPSNVLVTEIDGRPVPKVIDFGVAKAIAGQLADNPDLTGEGQALGTPPYMSPEQLDGAPGIDTRADVYALGVLLFELITGRVPLPLSESGLHAFRTRVRDEIPSRPSVAARLFNGRAVSERVPIDLDWIVLRCLEKEPDRRYPTALALARDVERLIRRHPVEAAPPSTWYRVRKLAGRHRVAAVTLLIAAAGVIASVIAATAGFVEARHQAAIARAVTDFFNRDVLPSVAPSSQPGRGRDVTMREVLDTAARKIETASRPGGEFAGAPRVEAAVRRAIGDTYFLLGEVPHAEQHLTRVHDLLRAALGPDHEDTLEVAQDRASALRALGRYVEAETLQRDVVGRRLRTLGANDYGTLTSQQGLALLLVTLGRNDEALALAGEVLARLQDGEDPRTQGIRQNLGIVLARCGRYDEAEALFRKALAVERRFLAPADPDLLSSLTNLAALLRARDRDDEAVALLEEVHAAQRQVLGDDHPNTLVTACNLGDLWVQSGRPRDAERLLEPTLAAARRTHGDQQVHTLRLMASLGRARQATGDLPAAEALFRDALRGSEQSVGEETIETVAFLNDLASVLEEQRRDAEIEPLLRRSLALSERVFGADHAHAALARRNLAHFLRRTGRAVDAVEPIDRAERAPAGP